MDINQKKRIFKWFGFGIMILPFVLALAFLFGYNVLNFPFMHTPPPAGAIIDFSPLYNLLFWYLFLRLMVTVGEKVILRTDTLIQTDKPADDKKKNM